MCLQTSRRLCHIRVIAGMSPASVTLASALQVRGEALSEEEIWSLLSLAAERLLEDLQEGKRECLGQVNHSELRAKLPKHISGCCFSDVLPGGQRTPTFGAALGRQAWLLDLVHSRAERKALLLGRQGLLRLGPLPTPGQSQHKETGSRRQLPGQQTTPG